MYTFDSKDYNPESKRIYRNAVRAIIFIDDKLAMIQSSKYGDIKFPGGGVNAGEDNISALKREVQEETGLIIKLDTVNEYARVREIRKSIFELDQIFDATSIYYTCEVEDEIGEINLDPYEIEYGYKLIYIEPQKAIISNNLIELAWVKRENFILEKLLKGVKKWFIYM